MNEPFTTRIATRKQYRFTSGLEAEEILKSLGWSSTSQYLKEKKDWADLLQIQFAYLGWDDDITWTAFIQQCSGLWIEFINGQILLRSRKQIDIKEMEILYIDNDGDTLYCYRNGGICAGFKQTDLAASEYCGDCKYTHWEINEDFSEKDFNSCGKKIKFPK